MTPEQLQRLKEYLETHELSCGLGEDESCCTLAAINLALTGRITDDIPDCMSRVIGKWIIVIQDAMPGAVRNSTEWKDLIPLAAGTWRGPDHEQQRLEIILDWMWGTVLPQLQSVADKYGFGDAWKRMTSERTVSAAAAHAADYAAAHAAAAHAAAYAADAAAYAADAAAYAADAAAYAADDAAYAADDAAYAADAAAYAADDANDFWSKVDPVGLLSKLIEA